jgi:hypothetical protein
MSSESAFIVSRPECINGFKGRELDPIANIVHSVSPKLSLRKRFILGF